jgi:hypothetical protein
VRAPRLLLAVLLTVTALVVAACGGDDDGASSSTDVNELLAQTFTGTKEMKSGKLAFKVKLDAQGQGAAQLQGPVDVSLSGPFDATDDGQLPKFALQASFAGAGQSLQAGATSTGDKGFLAFNGKNYVVDDQVFAQFKQGYEEAAKQGSGNNAQSLASLGMDPRKWLTNPTNAGEAKVGDEDTIKITGGIDVAKLLDDVNAALAKASSLGLQGSSQVPDKLTDAQKQEIVKSIKDPKVEIYTGKDDKIMRRMVVSLGLDDQASDTSGTLSLDFSISDLNEGQDIAEPANPAPFSELLGQLGGLSGLAGAAGSGSGSGSASGSGSSGSGSGSGGGSAKDFEKFSKCLEDAGQDVQEAQKCSELLQP